MFDLNFELPAIILLVIFLATYVGERRLPVEHSRVYAVAIGINLVTTFFNLFSAYVDADLSAYPVALALFLNVGFYFFDILRYFAFLWYFITNSAMRLNISARITNLIGLLVAEALTGFGMASGNFFVINGNVFRLTGWYILIDVIIFIICFFEALILIGPIRENADRRVILYFSGAIVVQAAIGVCDIIFPYLIMSDILSSIVFLLFYLAVENPSLYRSTDANTFNFDGMEMMFENGQFATHRIYGVGLTNYRVLRNIYLSTSVRRAVRLAGEFMMEQPDTYPFYVGDGQLVVLCGKKNPDIREAFSKRCQSSFSARSLEIYFDAGYVEVAPDPGCIPTDIGLFQTDMKSVIFETKKNETVILDQSKVDAFHRRNLVYHILNDKVATNDVRMFL